MSFEQALWEWFVAPILANGWFNPINTAVYGAILVVASLAVYRLLARMAVPIDGRFLGAILPFILWGVTTRVLHDSAVAGVLSPELTAFYSLKIFPTPGSYIITFALALFALLISLLVQRWTKFAYWKTMAGIGTALTAVNLALLPFVNPAIPLLVLVLTGLWTALFFGYSRWQPGLLSKVNAGILSAHMLDASATVVATVLLGYLEQHVLPRLLFGWVGPYPFFLLKFAVIWPVLYLVDRYTEPGSFRNFIKIVILILGLAPGLRTALRLAVGV